MNPAHRPSLPGTVFNVIRLLSPIPREPNRQTVKLTLSSSGIPREPICKRPVLSKQTKPPTYPFIIYLVKELSEAKTTDVALHLERNQLPVPAISTSSVEATPPPVEGYLRAGGESRKRESGL